MNKLPLPPPPLGWSNWANRTYLIELRFAELISENPHLALEPEWQWMCRRVATAEIDNANSKL